jgi:hypothetical protein
MNLWKENIILKSFNLPKGIGNRFGLSVTAYVEAGGYVNAKWNLLDNTRTYSSGFYARAVFETYGFGFYDRHQAKWSSGNNFIGG